MNVEYTGRGTAITWKLKQLAEAELARIAKIAGRVVSVHVILTEDKYRQIAEVTMKTGDDILVALCEGTEMAATLHEAMRRLEQQAVRQNQRKTTLARHPKTVTAVNLNLRSAENLNPPGLMPGF
jgi:putative sigma-54 modulation protein